MDIIGENFTKCYTLCTRGRLNHVFSPRLGLLGVAERHDWYIYKNAKILRTYYENIGKIANFSSRLVKISTINSIYIWSVEYSSLLCTKWWCYKIYLCTLCAYLYRLWCSVYLIQECHTACLWKYSWWLRCPLKLLQISYGVNDDDDTLC